MLCGWCCSAELKGVLNWTKVTVKAFTLLQKKIIFKMNAVEIVYSLKNTETKYTMVFNSYQLW